MINVAGCDLAEAVTGPAQVPSTVEEFDVPGNLIEELALKVLFMAGQS